MAMRGAAGKIKQAVSAWDHVEAHPHRFGGTEYRIGRREIGHVHGDTLVDIPFPKKVRDEIIAAGEAQPGGFAARPAVACRANDRVPPVRHPAGTKPAGQPHHILPETGWVSFYIQEEADVEKAIRLLKRSYEIALRQRG